MSEPVSRAHLDVVVMRETAVAEFFKTAAELLKLCIPLVKEAVAKGKR